MSDSEAESVEEVEVQAPLKKGRPPMSDERRKQMLENLAKGRKTRAANLSNKRLEKETAKVKEEQEHKCDHCGSQFKYKASKNKHVKTCKDNPENVDVEDKPLDLPPKENVVVEKKEKEEEPPLKLKVERKRRKKKVIYKDYSSSDSDSDEEVVVVQKRKPRRKGRVVYADGVDFPQPTPLQRQSVQPVQPPKPQITEAQKQAILQRRQQEQKYAEIGRKQEAEANRIKTLSANMLRKNRF